MQPSFVEDVFSFDNDYESSASVSRSRSPSPKSRRVHYSVAPVPIRVHREASPAPVGSGSPTPLPLDERDAQTRRWIHTQFRPSQPLYDEYEDSFNTPTKSVFDSDTEDEVDEDELLSDEEEDVEDDCSSTSSSSSSDDSDSEAIYMQPSNRTSFTSLFPQPPTTIPVVVPIRRPSPVRSLASSQYRLRACASGGLRPLTPASAAPALLCPSRAAGSLVDTSSAVATPTFDTDEDLPALAHSESTASSSSSSSASSDDEERSVPIPIYISCPTSRGRRAKPGYDAYEDIHSPPHAARKERRMFRSNSWMHDWAMRPESYATRR